MAGVPVISPGVVTQTMTGPGNRGLVDPTNSNLQYSATILYDAWGNPVSMPTSQQLEQMLIKLDQLIFAVKLLAEPKSEANYESDLNAQNGIFQ